MSRNKELTTLLQLTPEAIIEKAGAHLKVVESVEAIDRFLADSMVSHIAENNRAGRPTVVIFPYGPVSQYPLFVQKVNAEDISLENTTIFFMDEYADESGRELPETHPLSFRGRAKALLSGIRDDLRMGDDRIIFPDSDNIDDLERLIDEAGPVQLCVGGIGINGHLAFNEPAPGIRTTGPRLVSLAEHTVTMNTIREQTGGDIINFPKKAFTIGMEQVFDSQRILLSCRNGTRDIQWSNAVLRLALLGAKGDDVPVSYLRDYDDFCIVTDRDTLRTPSTVL